MFPSSYSMYILNMGISMIYQSINFGFNETLHARWVLYLPIIASHQILQRTWYKLFLTSLKYKNKTKQITTTEPHLTLCSWPFFIEKLPKMDLLNFHFSSWNFFLNLIWPQCLPFFSSIPRVHGRLESILPVCFISKYKLWWKRALH